MSDEACRHEQLSAYVLAGGQSRRFGSDKARALLDGEPLVVRLTRQLKPMSRSVTVIAGQADAYADLGLRTIADVHPGCGPMAGLHAALRDVGEGGGDWLLLCSCDMVMMRPTWLAALLGARGEGGQAVAFRAERWHPFPGLYHRSLLEEVERRLAGEALRMQGLLDAVGTGLALPSDWPSVAQANTPGALARVARDNRR
ncbi:molybdenum cofactor guanylyltransferase [Phycisphaerales bacterium AB-hyl4]|uniref:Probable molybdenum cofactor guanylyltransferase n=1 Tax=Natronomicrosphaera hydrolytica TaxID=3242702 RepID=A0ABV4U085_9BACT